MVLSIITFTVLTDDNTPGPSITPPGCGYGKFSIVTAPLGRQAPLEIAKHRAVALVGKRPALFDQPQSRLRFIRYFLDSDFFDLCPWLILAIGGYYPAMEYEEAD
jgi:hypothetical protein